MNIKEHDVVIVPDPIDSDIHQHEFIGTVVHISKTGKYAMVEDQDGGVYTIEIERLALSEY